jgi:hypothetical protein
VLHAALQPYSAQSAGCAGEVLFIVAVIKTKSCLTSNANDIPPGLAARSHLAGFGLGMTKLPGLEEFGVFRRLVPKIGLVLALVLGLVPAIAHAQVNIDQGKPAAELFESDCATCHKTARGLANGRNSLMLSGFLREHYTASRDQAAALAAYVLGAGNAPPPKVSEPKTAGRPEDHPITASRGQKQAPELAAPAPVVTTPAANVTPSSAETPSPEGGAATSAAAPADSQPSDNAPVPRDHIPD